MRTSAARRTLVASAAALLLVAITMLVAPSARAADASIELEIYKAGFIVGASGGSGTLTFKGRKYPLTIGGVSLGATIGASKAELVGEVHNLKNVSDIAGTYTAAQAGVAVAGGAKIAELKNSRGVLIKVKGRQIGLEFSLDLSGLQVDLKK